ncbi:protein kinase domain-containing protein, partial [Streptomyces anulatus]|uniref:protein kinase domain-containing protein n=1 Tax=Streptomyces anulatus TaxID=1892 RepID=UPI003698E9DB
MSAKVTLTVVTGPSTGVHFAVDEKAHCVAGRAVDSTLRVVDDPEHPLVSRHHCLFDINPPDIRVRDFGSLNGTHVNGAEIGRRLPGQTPEEGARLEFRERDLADGDEVRLGKCVIRVGVVVSPTCGRCGRDVTVGLALCDRCRVTEHNDAPGAPRCQLCGRSTPGRRAGKQLCDDCRRDPQALLGALLQSVPRPGVGVPVIRGYEPVRELGRGGQGVVHLVRHTESGEARALKVLPAQVGVDPKAEQGFLREMDCIRGLHHPNIVGFREGGAEGATFYFVCEYCDRGSVDQLVKTKGPLGVGESVALITQVLEGLDYAHNVPVDWATIDTEPTAIGLVHRDVKPANILLAGPGTAPIVKLADFGLAKAFERAGLSGHTLTGSTAGTVGFMSRPQLINYKFARPEVDVWATAASLYFMLTCHTPREFPPTAPPRWTTRS